MKVASLHTYPIKGVRGIAHETCTTAHRGFIHDRRLMVVDANGNFITQRSHAILGLISAESDENSIVLTCEAGTASAVLNNEADAIDVTVWSDTVSAKHLPETDDLLSEFFGEPMRLVWMPESAKRETSVGGYVSFADGYPFLITNTASLSDLNSRIGEEISMDAFRSNIVVESDEPWSEDGWGRIGIGDAVFELISPCVRCKVTTLDPNDPTIVNPNQEPLRTLADFRRDPQRGGVTFGWNAMTLTPNVEVKVGDRVTRVG